MKALAAIEKLISNSINIENKTKYSNGFFIKVALPVPYDYYKQPYSIYFYNYETNTFIKDCVFGAKDLIEIEGLNDWEEHGSNFVTATKFLDMGFSVFRKAWLKTGNNKIDHMDKTGKMFYLNRTEYVPTEEDLKANDWMVSEHLHWNNKIN